MQTKQIHERCVVIRCFTMEAWDEEIPEHKIIQKLDTYGFSFFFNFT